MIDSVLRWFRRTFVPAYGLRNPTNRERFETVFRTRRWALGESVSGPGSDRTSGQVEHAIRVMVFNRLCDPESQLGVLRWLETVGARPGEFDEHGRMCSKPEIYCQHINLKRCDWGAR